MTSIYINKQWAKNKPKFFLCLPYPRRTIIRKLNDIYNVNVKFILGRVNELTFDIPAKVERNHELVSNELIKLFEGYYQVKMEWNGQVEYFTYVEGNRKFDNSGKNLSFKLYSTSYLIGKSSVPIYEETSKNLRFHAEHFLVDTNWSIGDIDSEFENKYREITASQSNALQCLYDLCEKFEAVMVLDTVNQIVHFKKPENIGINKGMTFKDGITLESLGQKIDYDKIITKLHVYGSDGLEFRRLSLVGVNYLMNLSWFIYPFEQDSNGNVIKSSKWLTDDFCKAYLLYQKKLQDRQPVFEDLVEQKDSLNDSIVQKESEISSEMTILRQIENELWVINKTYGEQASSRQDWQDAVTRKKAQEVRVISIIEEYNTLLANLETLEVAIENLRLDVIVENNLTPAQIIEMKEFTHAGYYTNDAITDDEDLLEDGEKAFMKVNQPPITISMGIVNFMNDIRFEKIRDRIALGDTVRVKSEDLDVYVSLKIIEIAYNIENDSITLTISNEEDLRDDMTKLVDEIYSSSHSSQIVDANKGNWDNGGKAFEEINKVINNPWDASQNFVIGGYENTTLINNNGLVSYEEPNSDTYLFINNGIFGITTDNLDSLEVAIDKNGVNAKVIRGDLILGNELKLTSENGILEADGDSIVIKDENGNVKVELGKYTNPINGNDTYGLNIIGGAFNLQTSDNPNRGTVINENGIQVYNDNGDIVFDTANGAQFTDEILLKDRFGGSTIASIAYFNQTLHYIAESQHIFENDVYVLGDIYMNGRKVATE